jgi:hypothetical protein
MLGFQHAYSRSQRRRAQPHGPRPRYCARKVGLCEGHDSEYFKNLDIHQLRLNPLDYLDAEGKQRLRPYIPNTE